VVIGYEKHGKKAYAAVNTNYGEGAWILQQDSTSLWIIPDPGRLLRVPDSDTLYTTFSSPSPETHHFLTG
jgi:hypothetical protein